MAPAMVRITDLADPGRTATIATTRARAELIADRLAGRNWPRYLVEIDPEETEPVKTLIAILAALAGRVAPALRLKVILIAVAAILYLALVAAAVFVKNPEARAILVGAAVAVAYGAGLATDAALAAAPPKE